MLQQVSALAQDKIVLFLEWWTFTVSEFVEEQWSARTLEISKVEIISHTADHSGYKIHMEILAIL